MWRKNNLRLFDGVLFLGIISQATLRKQRRENFFVFSKKTVEVLCKVRGFTNLGQAVVLGGE